jgi:hypothetical protein
MCLARLPRLDDRKPFTLRRAREPIVERDEFQGIRLPFGGG